MSNFKLAWSSGSAQAYLPKLMRCYQPQKICEEMQIKQDFGKDKNSITATLLKEM